MSTLYGNSAATALRLIAKFGKSITINYVQRQAYDPNTGAIAATPSQVTANALEMEYTVLETDGTFVQRGDKKLLLAASGLTRPTVEDTVTVDGITHTVKNVKVFNPGGTPLTYELQARV